MTGRSASTLSDRLKITDADLLAAGTLHLRDIRINRPELWRNGASAEDLRAYDGWIVYHPGLLAQLQRDDRAPSTSFSHKSRSTSSAHVSPASGSRHKRKRSKASSTPLDSPTPSLTSATSSSSLSSSDHHSNGSAVHGSIDEPPSALFPLPPNLRNLDHLVTNVFARIEFRLLGASASSPEDVGGKDGELFPDVPNPSYEAVFRVWIIPKDAPGLNSRIAAIRAKVREPKVTTQASAAFSRVFHHLRWDTHEWTQGTLVNDPKYVLQRNKRLPSLLELYNHLQDPLPSSELDVDADNRAILTDILKEDAPEGMSGRLYEFQKHCLWKLVSREIAPQHKIDLTFQELQSVDSRGQAYYMDAKYQLWRTAQYHLEPRSAIVAEGMGTGKTCICLALVLSLRHRLAKVDFDSAAPSQMSFVRTDKHESFPWAVGGLSTFGAVVPAEDQTARDPWQTARVPSLRDLTLDFVSTSMHQRTIQASVPLSWYKPTIQSLPYLWEIPPSKTRDDTRSSASIPRRVYISAATLVIVPDILVAQWLAEIKKHIKEGALDYIKIEKHDEMPTAAELCLLDLVLMSESKVRTEELRFWPQVPPPCKCTYAGNTRNILCKCPRQREYSISPLVEVYWKRLIVDEGHKVSGHSNLVNLCMRLRTEGRYVVSGTPSKNLVGLHDVKQEDQETYIESTADADKQDFERLANIANFIGLAPFTGEKGRALFMKAFYDPFLVRGDSSGIFDFLSRTVVRHRVPDLALPSLARKTVVLPFNALERMTYNVLLALFASNSVLSERTDEDYFFHPKQKAHLNTLISNLGAAHLLFSSKDLLQSAFNALVALEKGYAKNLEGPPSKRWCTADQELLMDAEGHLTAAVENSVWRYAQTGSMVYDVRWLPLELAKAWGGLPCDLVPHGVYLTGEKIGSLRHRIGKIADVDIMHMDDDDFLQELITFAAKEEKRQLEEKRDNDRTRAPKDASPRKRKRDSKALSATKAASGAFKQGTVTHEETDNPFNNLPLTSDFIKTDMPAMASSKVAYVIQSILEHPDEKFLIFAGGSSSSAQVTNNNLYYLSEALDLARISHLIFVRTLSQDKLAKYAKAFNDTAAFRVLLLDLKFAGRGLTLSKASRIIFTEPVWHKDEEAQAVKRAHRLGQDRPVFVETLVMKDSFEEQVMRRGTELSRREMADAKTPFQDAHLYNALRSMVFLPPAEPTSPHKHAFLTSLEPAIRLLPHDLEVADRYYQDVILDQIRQEAREELDAQLTSHTGSRAATAALSRSGSVSRSRSNTPALPLLTASPPVNKPLTSNGPSKPFARKKARFTKYDTEDEGDCVEVLASRFFR